MSEAFYADIRRLRRALEEVLEITRTHDFRLSGPAGAMKIAQKVKAGLNADMKAPPRDLDKEAATAMGRRGGNVGGKARAEALTPERRKEIAQKAAATRWKNKCPNQAVAPGQARREAQAPR